MRAAPRARRQRAQGKARPADQEERNRAWRLLLCAGILRLSCQGAVVDEALLEWARGYFALVKGR